MVLVWVDGGGGVRYEREKVLVASVSPMCRGAA